MDRRRGIIKLILIIVLGSCLLSFRLGGNDLFEDEVMGLRIATGTLTEVVLGAMKDVHPPFYFILLHYWTVITGVSGLSVRILSIIFAILTIWLTYTLARRLFSEETALFSALLVSISPYIVFYSRLARYYSLVTALYLLSILLLQQACRRDRLNWWSAYAASALALLYTNYGGLFALAGGFLYVMSKGKKRLLHYGLMLLCIALAFLPVVPWMLAQSQRYGPVKLPGTVEDYIAEIIGKIAFAGYALCLGETVLFWNVVVVIPAIILCALLFIYGLWKAFSTAHEGWQVWLAFYLVPFVGMTCALSLPAIGVFSARSMALFPARVVILAPLAYMVIAYGISSLRPGRRFVLTLTVLCLFCYSLSNLYFGWEYLNEKYVSPWRAVAEFVREQSAEADFVTSREKAFWFYYLDADMEKMSLQIKKRLVEDEARRVWIVERRRGDTTIGRRSRLGPGFATSYRLSGVYSFQPIDEQKRKIYSRLRGEDVGKYYIEARVYERIGDGEEGRR